MNDYMYLKEIIPVEEGEFVEYVHTVCESPGIKTAVKSYNQFFVSV